jgi:erythrin-vacuolar iron transport family protein
MVFVLGNVQTVLAGRRRAPDRGPQEPARRTTRRATATTDEQDGHEFVLRTVQPALLGLADGSISTLAPLFATAVATHDPHVALLVGLAAALGAAISMGVSEALSDDGSLTGRGHPLRRALVTGTGTLIGAGGHSLPFLIPDYRTAMTVAVIVVVLELLAIAYVRWRWFPGTSVRASIAQVTLAGLVVFAVGLAFGGA